MAKKILYVEGNLYNMLLVRRILRAEGHELLEATDGESGWATAVAERPDLILIDLHLSGGISGIDLTRRLKSHSELKQIPIIALTAYNSAALEEEALAAGCDGFLIKPADIQQIRTAVYHHLDTPLPTLMSEERLNSFVAAY